MTNATPTRRPIGSLDRYLSLLSEEARRAAVLEVLTAAHAPSTVRVAAEVSLAAARVQVLAYADTRLADRYQGADAAGDRPCVVTAGVDADALARWAKAGADVLAEVAT